MNDDLITRINKNIANMSKGQKKIARFILNNYDKAAFMTAARIGMEVSISESTVVRFAMLLGYEGYPAFQKALELLVQEKLNSIERIELSSLSMTKSEVLSKIMKSDAEKIKLTLDMIDKDAFEQAVENIENARKIYVLGIRSCAPLASFLSFYLNMMFDDVILVTTNNSSELFEQMLRMNEKDVVIGISFPRYSVRTLKALEFANDRNSKVIAITDNKHSPLTLYSSCNLFARSDMATVVDSLVAPLSVINALIVSLCIKRQDKVTDNLDTLEKIWNDYQTYSPDEFDYFNEEVKINIIDNGEQNYE